MENLITETKNILSSGGIDNRKPRTTTEHKLSHSEILLRSIKSSSPLNEIQDLLNREMEQGNNLPPIHCWKSRPNNLLIVKSDTDDNTEKLLERIEMIQNITETVEINTNYKISKKKK